MATDVPSVSAWLEHRHGNDVAAAALDAASAHPYLFARLVLEANDFGLDLEDLADVVGEAWYLAGDVALPREVWTELFAVAGYREDDVPAERPTSPLRLYRGSPEALKANWSWTPHPEIARVYAAKCDGTVWTAVVEPVRLLARFRHEYIVDTDGMVIEKSM